MIIQHRINSIEELKSTNKDKGIEVDIRWSDKFNKLIITHDLPNRQYLFLEDYLNFYEHKLLILNIKSSLCEEPCIDLMEKFAIKNYYFLDSQIPDIVRHKKNGRNNFIIRYSNFEYPSQSLLQDSKYVWVDTFGSPYFDYSYVTNLIYAGYELIFVSPELHKSDKIDALVTSVKGFGFSNMINVCTKISTKWDFLC